MIRRNVTNLPLENFQEMSKDKKVVLLYPWVNYRNLFLSYYLHNGKEGFLYHRVAGEHENLNSWIKALVKEFQFVLKKGFGKNLEKVMDKGDPIQLGEALAKDLGAYDKKRVVLFLDELDRVPQDADFREFATVLVDNLPKQVQIAISSRMLTYDPWIKMVADRDAVVLGTEFRRNNLMFTVEREFKPQVEVYSFGQGVGLANGRQIGQWDGALPRNLFFFFMDNPLVTRQQIFEHFWPKLKVKDATNVFHVTKRKITERITACIEKDDESYELTKYSAGFYMPSEKIVRHYDVDDFTEAVEQAMISEDEHTRELLYKRAIDIYRGPFLSTIDMPWVLKKREELAQMYAEALLGMARMFDKRERYDVALGYYTRSLKEMPQREDLHRDAMRMYIEMGRNADAMEQYKRLVAYLDQEVGVPPSPQTRKLYESLMEE